MSSRKTVGPRMKPWGTPVLKVQLCKLYKNKDMIALIQITKTDIFAFIAVLVLSYLAVSICWLSENTTETVIK